MHFSFRNANKRLTFANRFKFRFAKSLRFLTISVVVKVYIMNYSETPVVTCNAKILKQMALYGISNRS